jgi:PST family polysaccharide transporter/lipopolysaccharide exporter
VAVLQVLCLYGLSRAYLKTTENLYLAAGQPKIMTKINLLQLILMAVLIYPLTLRYGIPGIGIAAAVPPALVL